jgi:hypothetical protein
MSRYTIPQPDPAYLAIAGWENPIQTYFAQVFDLHAPEDEDECVYQIVQSPLEYPTVAALQDKLGDIVTIPPAIWTALEADQRTSAPPTPLQKWMGRQMAVPQREGRVS